MKTLKTTLVSALAVGALTVTFAGDALAEHERGKGWNKGRGGRTVEVFVDAGPNRALQEMVAYNLERHNPNINVVRAKRYADVVVRVNGYLSEPYRINTRDRYGSNLFAMDYDYNIQVRAGGRVIHRDRVRGQVTELAGRDQRHRGGYHYNSYSREEFARDAFLILVEAIAHKRGRGYGGYAGIEEELAYEAFQEVADYAGHIKIPRRFRKYGR